MEEASERIRRLRKHALNCAGPSQEWAYYLAKGFIESGKTEKSTSIRHGMAKRYQLEHVRPVIDEDELIVGKYSALPLEEAQQAEYELIKRYALPAQPVQEGQASHMAVDYQKLLRLGCDGVIREIRQRMEILDCAQPDQMERYSFYESCIQALEGLCALSDHYADEAERQAESASPERRAELQQIAEICRHVPRYPARGFHEALQACHLLSVAMVGLYQLGRPDRYLYRYYLNDIRSGRLNREQAQELIDCLCILYNEYIDRGLAVGFMVGGRDAYGRDVYNELTELFLRSIPHTAMIYPGIGFCVNEDTPAPLLRLSCEILGQGHSHPALFNDDVIIKGLLRYGLPYSEACEYIHCTCVEITPCCSSACWVASPYVNLPQLLLDTLNITPEGGKPTQYPDFEALCAAFRERLNGHMRECIIEQNRIQAERTHFSGDPLVSCFVNDCLSKGVDIEQGGARYNWIMPSFVGMANLADALFAIKTLVYDRKEIDLDTLAQALQQNFKGFEALRGKILNRVAKYGNDDDEADAMVLKIVDWLQASISGYKSYRGGRFIPSMFCWIMHDEFGKCTMATPDGRTAGFTLGDGSGPAQGREKNGPTASILSSTKWAHDPFIGGIAVNMKFGKRMFNESSLEKLESLIRVFMKRGGFELQINVVDKQTLLNAQKQPELYQDLVVRIGGYSDYFTRLTPAKQLEVIERTEHEL